MGKGAEDGAAAGAPGVAWKLGSAAEVGVIPPPSSASASPSRQNVPLRPPRGRTAQFGDLWHRENQAHPQ